jgi:hypothetical protein
MSEVANKEISGFEGTYWISLSGQVTSHIRKGSSRGVVKPYLNNRGYMIVSLYKDGNRTNRSVHRLVASHFIDNPRHLEFVNHINGDKTDNSISNLEWCTSSENSKHAILTGLRKPPMTRGERIGLSKLTECIVKIIREEYAAGLVSYEELAYEYGVAKSTIERVINRKTWRHV